MTRQSSVAIEGVQTDMFSRKVVTASAAAALALGALAVPAVHAQSDQIPGGDADAGSLSAGSLEGGSLDAGSLTGGSLAGGGSGGDDAEGGEGGDGASGSLGSEGGSRDMLPASDEVCDLPDLGGSVAKFYPLFGISGVPTGVLDLITTALGEFPNVLDVLTGEGGGAALLGQSGSAEGPLCSTIFGGEMVMPPVTVIVDEDGNPITTVTGTIAASASTTTSTSASSSTAGPASDEGPAGVNESDTEADGSGAGVGGGDVVSGEGVGFAAIPTTVPVP